MILLKITDDFQSFYHWLIEKNQLILKMRNFLFKKKYYITYLKHEHTTGKLSTSCLIHVGLNKLKEYTCTAVPYLH